MSIDENQEYLEMIEAIVRNTVTRGGVYTRCLRCDRCVLMETSLDKVDENNNYLISWTSNTLSVLGCGCYNTVIYETEGSSVLYRCGDCLKPIARLEADRSDDEFINSVDEPSANGDSSKLRRFYRFLPPGERCELECNECNTGFVIVNMLKAEQQQFDGINEDDKKLSIKLFKEYLKKLKKHLKITD